MSDGDGVALFATRHPYMATKEQLQAGDKVFCERWGKSGMEAVRHAMLQVIYDAMMHAAPPLPEDLNPDNLVEAWIELPDPPWLEELAIKCAKGNNGGDWDKNYKEEHKEHWRQFARDLVSFVRSH